MDKNLQRFREVFLEEAREHLDTMESGLLGLEAGGQADPELLNRIFRSAHTIKGGSGMFGLEDTARFTHSLENLLDQVRGGKIAPTPPLVDVLLRSCDVLKALLAAAHHGGGAPAEMESVLAALQEANVMAPASGGAPAEDSRDVEARPAQASAPAGPLRHWKIRLTPAPDALRRGLDPLLALRELAELGRISDLRADPSALPPLASLDPETSYLSWTLQLDSAEPEARIRETFEFLHDGHGLELSEGTASAPSLANTSVPSAEISAPAQGGESSSTIRVDVDLLDRLMNQVGELVLARNQILQFSNLADDAALATASQRLNLITSELQEGVMKTRMQPIGVAWSMMPRLVRDLANSCGKQIELQMEGSETELDRTIIEAIKDPLTHLVRNSCDHGLEAPSTREGSGKSARGNLLLRAFHEGGHVIIEVADDGAGIDLARVKSKALERRLITPEKASQMSEREAIHLIFLPGFSTAERVSSISGRGVGMDVVKTNIERIGGSVDLASRTGQGTTVRVKIPLTLAIIPGMVVEGGGEQFVIPQVSLVELVRLEEEQARERIERIHETPVCRLRGKLLPLVYLDEILQLSVTGAASGPDTSAPPAKSGAVNIVVLQAEERQFGLVVEGIRDTQEIVVKPLGKQLKGLPAYSGATVMGDGKVALILDVLGLAQLAGFAAGGYAADRHAESAAESASGDRQALLLFRSPGFERMAVPLSLVARLEEFPKERIEQSAGRRVLQYRERILPLVSLDGVLGPGESELPPGPVQAIVFMDGERGVGLLVGEILDIVEENVRVRKESSRKGILGSAVVGGRVTDLLDLAEILDAPGENWFGEGRSASHATVLVADPSPFTRAMIRSSLEMAGHHVVEASSGAEVLERLDKFRVDVVALAKELGSAADGAPLVERIRKQTGRPVPVLGLGYEAEAGGEESFDRFARKFHREEMVSSIRELLAQ